MLYILLWLLVIVKEVCKMCGEDRMQCCCFLKTPSSSVIPDEIDRFWTPKRRNDQTGTARANGSSSRG